MTHLPTTSQSRALRQTAKDLKAQAYELEQVADALRRGQVLLTSVTGEGDLDVLVEQAGIPVISELEARPDAELGHVFQWPPEVAQFLAGD